MAVQLTFDLFVPDRFEGLNKQASHQLNSIIEPVDEALRRIDSLFLDMNSSGRGAFLLLRGESGAGKSTFLHTINMFREGVETLSITASASVKESLRKFSPSNARLQILVLEEREALKDISEKELETDLHAINGFIRSERGCKCIIVWPCNTDDLQQRILAQSDQIGADALLGVDEPVYRFTGPSRDSFRKIAEKTVAVLNQGAALADLGLSNAEIENLITTSPTVGKLLGMIRKSINTKRSEVQSLLVKEQCKLWIVVGAGNEPDRDVAALTRGQHCEIDIERLMSATGANVVQELKAYPEKLGILGTVLDAKIFHIPMLAVLDICREFGDTDLLSRMQKANLSDRPTVNSKAVERLANTDLAKVILSGTQGTMSPGGKPGPNTVDSFKKLMTVAQSADVAINRAIGTALKAGRYIEDFRVEVDLGNGLTRRTDLYCSTKSGVIRLEMMWRTRTSRAEIANYTLGKLYNYGKAIGFL